MLSFFGQWMNLCPFFIWKLHDVTLNVPKLCIPAFWCYQNLTECSVVVLSTIYEFCLVCIRCLLKISAIQDK